MRDRGEAVFEKHPQIALLGTAKDGPLHWLRAGQALERVLLQATSDGLATSLMSQPLEWPELRSFARDPNSAAGFVHMLLRLGYGPSGLLRRAGRSMRSSASGDTAYHAP